MDVIRNRVSGGGSSPSCVAEECESPATLPLLGCCFKVEAWLHLGISGLGVFFW